MQVIRRRSYDLDSPEFVVSAPKAPPFTRHHNDTSHTNVLRSMSLHSQCKWLSATPPFYPLFGVLLLSPACFEQVCKYLSQCVAETVEEVACGLLLVGLALHTVSPAQRYSPEPLVFLTDALWSFVGRSSAAAPAPTTLLSPAANSSGRDKDSGSTKGSKGKGVSSSNSGASTAGGLEREGGLSLPRVAPGVLAPSAQGASLVNVQPEETQLLAWLERANSGASSSSSGRGGGSRSGNKGERGSKKGEMGTRGEEVPQGDGVKLGLLSMVLKAAELQNQTSLPLKRGCTLCRLTQWLCPQYSRV
eukprot:1161689-Pelagomonas_calceolata.AAC.3